MKVISHSADADGRLSAYLVAKKFGLDNESDFIMTDYGKNDDIFSKIKKDEKVIICDFSLQNGVEDMKKLMKITKDIIWIDHHISSINDYGDFGKNIPGIRVNGTAACMLTYIYFFLYDAKGVLNLTQEECEKLYSKAPLVVRLVHDNDVWRYDYKETGKFKLGLDSLSIESPLDFRWNNLMNNESFINKLVDSGSYLERYRDSLGKYATKSYGFEYEINGLKGFCLNNVFGGSYWFGDIINDYDFVCSFLYMGQEKQWEYSFYSVKENVNCADIAKSVNPKGGGHKGAAGCVTKELIFK